MALGQVIAIDMFIILRLVHCIDYFSTPKVISVSVKVVMDSALGIYSMFVVSKKTQCEWHSMIFILA